MGEGSVSFVVTTNFNNFGILFFSFILVISGLLEALLWDGGLDDLGIDIVAHDRNGFESGDSIDSLLR